MLKLSLVSFFFVLIPTALLAGEPIHHEMQVVLYPGSHRLQVDDQITLPSSLSPDEEGKLHFLIHEGLSPHSSTAGVVIAREIDTPGRIDPIRGVPLTHYTVILPIGLRVFVLTYEGEIKHPLTGRGGPSYPDGGETPGTISSEGIFLSGETFWYPYFYTDLLTFNIDIELPKDWSAVSQGDRTIRMAGGETVALRWESPEPQEEIYLVGGKWTEYQRDAGRVTAMAFLRNPDPGLAERYLKATEQYLEMYQKLLGPYPYKKFALVENFWETGYGMPSFTLLGSKVLRLPFILHSSYPHEILHNWWGNGVYVDQDSGNWSEGLTTYLADYLIQEQHQNGLASRRAALQRYADYVTANNDFPLSEFLARHDAASQAVGYGKTMFLLHMLRQKLGDEVFVESLRTFYRENHFKSASFEDLMYAFSRTSRIDLSKEFMQWVTQKGAPIFRARQVRSEQTDKGYLLTALIQQRQRGSAYALDIPIAVTLHGKEEAYQTTVRMEEKELALEIPLPGRPIRLKIDPEFDLFRRLHPSEMPPSLSKVFGSESILILLPSAASEALRQGYQALAESWRQSQPGQIELAWDNQVDTLPKDHSVWLFGWENRFQDKMISQLQGYGLSMTSAMTRIEAVQIPRRRHSLVLAARHPDDPKRSIAWLATDLVDALPVLGRKLPHYGPFGFLGFSGVESRNVEKGRWPVVRSPMSIRVRQADGRWFKEKPAHLRSRQVLASLSPLFSEKRIKKDIAYLTKKGLKGRGFGSPELDRAAEYIATGFRRIGLKPGGASRRSYLQQWRGEGRGLGSGIALKNVVGILPGSDPALAGEQVVVGAHYDHLGFGWPRVHQGDEGKLHPGANSNASGVALLLELARILKKDKPLKRSIIFIAFTGGEVGYRGSKHFASKGKPVFQDHLEGKNRIVGMINLDTIGRLQKNRLIVLGAGSAREWPPMLREVGFQTGLKIAVLPDIVGEGDHLSFIRAGIPAIQFFGGITPDSGQPGDTLDKIDLSGMTRIGRVLKEVVKDLADRSEPLTLAPTGWNEASLVWHRRPEKE